MFIYSFTTEEEEKIKKKNCRQIRQNMKKKKSTDKGRPGRQ